MIQLRDYQTAAIDSALQALATSGSAIIQLPTGSGKTETAVEMIGREAGVVWFVCHRREIESQVSAALTVAGIEHGIVSPRGPAEYDKRVQVVSVDSLAARIADLPVPALVFWDECHHVAAKSWAAIREHLVDAKHIGLTATPERLDGKGLREWFAELIVGPSISALIEQGWLSPYRYFAPSIPDLTNAKMQAGDYRKRDADAVMNTPVLIGDAVSEYKRNTDGKRAIAFCVTVEASKALVARFNAEGVPASHVDGKTPDDARKAAIAALESGEIKVLSNVGVFNEGFNLPGIEAAILMRPTKSPTLFLQMIGRALRPAPGKVAVIMDHAGLHCEPGLGLPDGNWHWSIDGGAAKARRASAERGPRRCPECKEVRAERVEVCACGFEFPTGRDVGEFDGVLGEVRGVVPDGCESLVRLSMRYGVANRTAMLWRERGMPNYGNFIPVIAADAWIKENVDLTKTSRIAELHTPPDGYANQRGFARRHGFTSEHFTKKAMRMGLPNIRSLIPITEGDEWVKANASWVDRALTSSMQKQPRLAGYVSPSEFARIIKKTTVKTWCAVEPAFPYNPKLGIPIQAGLEWVRDNRPDITIPPEAWPQANDNVVSERAA